MIFQNTRLVSKKCEAPGPNNGRVAAIDFRPASQSRPGNANAIPSRRDGYRPPGGSRFKDFLSKSAEADSFSSPPAITPAGSRVLMRRLLTSAHGRVPNYRIDPLRDLVVNRTADGRAQVVSNALPPLRHARLGPARVLRQAPLESPRVPSSAPHTVRSHRVRSFDLCWRSSRQDS